MRAVLDPNVIISALLAPAGAPAQVFRLWVLGVFELIVSPLLLEELERALGYSKLRKRITEEETRRTVGLLKDRATPGTDPKDSAPLKSKDPGDDYLIALARMQNAALVSGDGHLLEMREKIPIYPPRGFLELLQSS
ncbi:MAG: putative toxin-antitoxin system toxin component, PIN family [Actinomycetota bacterium]